MEVTTADYTLITGKCEDALSRFPVDYFHGCVTDPPYNLGFMGKSWDDLGGPAIFQFWCKTWGKALLRVLRPGAHVLVFGGTRTYHRMIGGLEDAGFIVRDGLMWLYGQGMPKGMNVGKAIDKAARWEGWHTALKPAWEPIALLQKPPDRPTADNVVRWGCGALNIDACRIAAADGVPLFSRLHERNTHVYGDGLNGSNRTGVIDTTTGRYPANVLMDEEAAAILDAQTGTLTSGAKSGTRNPDTGGRVAYAAFNGGEMIRDYASDSGGASRFFYQAKAKKHDRGDDNDHVTVKPIRLIRYLTRLIAPEYSALIDPFMGSGRHGIAAICEGMTYAGIELDEANTRIAARHLPRALDWLDTTDPFGE